MKQTREYVLSKATFNVVEYTAAEVAALSPDDLLLLAETAEAQWSYRRGARKENDGKEFTLADIVSDIRATGSNRPGKVTDKDKENAEVAFKKLHKWAVETVGKPEGWLETEIADAIDASIWENFEDQVASVEKEHKFTLERPTLEESGEPDLTVDSLHAFLPTWCRSLRLAIDRNANAAKKKGLFS